MSMISLLFLTSTTLFFTLAVADDQLLKPVLQGDTNFALIMLQGAQIDAVAYVPLAEAIQKASNLSLWIVIPDVPLDAQNPLVVSSSISGAKSLLLKNGFPESDMGNLFFGGHSLGGVMVQDYVNSNSDGILGQILMGASLQRKYRKSDFPVSTLAIAGTFDGLYRITRMAEELYNRCSSDETRFPVVAIDGMNHMQFASGKAPALVQNRDLIAVLNFSQAHDAAAEVISDFLTSIVEPENSRMVQHVKNSRVLYEPIVRAFEYEGGRYFNAPTQKGGPSENCPKGGCKGPGSQWAITAQNILASDPRLSDLEIKLDVTNEFVQLSSLPPFGEYHLPSITKETENVRLLKTYSQNAWSYDPLDTAFFPESASEIGTKMMSRQCVLIRGANVSKSEAPFSLDDPDFCAIINEEAFNWALDAASKDASSRFASYGQRLIYGKDSQKSGGPFWIDARLEFNSKTLSTGENVIEVVSPMIKTSYDFPIIPPFPDPACYHYCKLMSPARAMEWIYLDGLRLNMGLSSKQ